MDLVAHVCFPASILTSTASSHFSCGALQFRWLINYTLLASSSSYHSPMAPATTHPFSIRASASSSMDFWFSNLIRLTAVVDDAKVIEIMIAYGKCLQLKSRNLEALYEPSSKGCNVEPGRIVSVIGSLQYENSDHVLSPTWSARVFSPSGVPDIQWRPGSSFQTQHEYTCTLNSNKYNNNEAAPFLECRLFLEELISNFQHSKTLFYNSSSGWGGAPPASPNTATSAQQQNLIHLQSSQQMLTGSKDSANNNSKVDDIEQQQQQIHQQSVTSDDSIPDPAQSPVLNKNTSNEEDSIVSYALDMQQKQHKAHAMLTCHLVSHYNQTSRLAWV
ncbi:unnamed protein product [Lactuca saligna]|uniref:Uncharacterized protein n=1 Tax=Lactuca saligna TaxID=75948 RepID=A0AA35ZVW1_LACSI|nr:unnamed protein product [Lactuca saligna]